MWLKSQLPLWGPLAPSAWLGLDLFSWWYSLPFHVGNVSLPWAFLQPAPPRPHFLSSAQLSTVWTPSCPFRAQPGAGPEFASPSFFPASLALHEKGWDLLSSRMWNQGAGPSLPCLLFQMRCSGTGMGASLQGSRLHGKSWTAPGTEVQTVIAVFHCTKWPAQSLCRKCTHR